MEISVDLSVLMSHMQWTQALPDLPSRLRAAGIEPVDIALEKVSNACTTEHVLTNEYMLKHSHPPVGEIYRVIINGTSQLPLANLASVVAQLLPIDGYWIGSAEIGHTELGLGTELAWQEEQGHN